MGAEETAAFLQANGGSASGQQLDEFANQRDSIAQERSEREHAAAEKAQRARQLEKTAPQDAAILYRECIEFAVENARESEDPWAWNHVPYLYNRYTLLLERSRAYDEALKAIAEYMGLACDDIGSKADREAIAKRQIRITAKKSRI